MLLFANQSSPVTTSEKQLAKRQLVEKLSLWTGRDVASNKQIKTLASVNFVFLLFIVIINILNSKEGILAIDIASVIFFLIVSCDVTRSGQ